MLSLFNPVNLFFILVLVFATYLVTRKLISGESYTDIIKASFVFLLGYAKQLIAYFTKKGEKSE
jgi:hypothetical protein